MKLSEIKVQTGLVTKPLARVLYISRMFAMAPVSLSQFRQSNTMSEIYIVCPNKKYAIIGLTYFMLLLAVYLTDIVYNQFFVNHAKEIRVRTGVSLIIHIIHTVFFCGVMTLHANVAFHKMKCYVGYLNTIEKLNKELGSPFMSIKVKFENVFVALPLSIINVVGSIYLCQRIKEMLFDNKDTSIFIKQAIYFIWYNCIMLLQLRFMFIAFYLNETIKVLIMNLQALTFKLKLYSSLENKIENTAYITIQRLCRIYTFICELVKKIEEQEGIIILCIFIFKLIDIMDALLLIVSSFMSRDHISLGFITDNMLEMFWILVRGTTIVLLVEPCHQTWAKVGALQLAVSDLLCTATNIELREELYKFSRLLLVHVPVFSPLGMFPFTRQQLVFLSGVLFTFMVIVTQFRLRDEIGNQTTSD